MPPEIGNFVYGRCRVRGWPFSHGFLLDDENKSANALLATWYTYLKQIDILRRQIKNCCLLRKNECPCLIQVPEHVRPDCRMAKCRSINQCPYAIQFVKTIKSTRNTPATPGCFLLALVY